MTSTPSPSRLQLPDGIDTVLTACAADVWARKVALELAAGYHPLELTVSAERAHAEALGVLRGTALTVELLNFLPPGTIAEDVVAERLAAVGLLRWDPKRLGPLAHLPGVRTIPRLASWTMATKAATNFINAHR